jgi:hypothetical protein
VKPGTEGSTKTPAGSSVATNTKSPPARPRVGKVGVASSAKEAGTPISTLKRATTTSNKETKKKVFSPVRDPHGNSGSTGEISGKLS